MSTRVIQVRLSRDPGWEKQGGWEVCRRRLPGLLRGKRPTKRVDYARQRMGYGRCDLQVLDENWNVVETITNEDLKPIV